jgi:hypothetical protein
MANLAETQIHFRRILIIIFVASIAFYSFRGIIRQSIKLYNYLLPTKTIDPEAKFGFVPQLKMNTIKIAGKPEYVIDTPNGQLPTFPDRLLVYPIPEPKATLLSEQAVKSLAVDLKFGADFTKNNVSEFRWNDGNNNRTFAVDAISQNFQLNTSIDKLTAIASAAFSITDADAKQVVTNFIKSKSLMQQSDLENMRLVTIPSITTLGKIRESKIDIDRAKMMKVDVFRDIVTVKADAAKKIPETRFKILGPNPKNSLISFYTLNSTSDENLFRYPIINFNYWKVDYANGSPYYLAPIENVWQTIRAGNGVTTYLRIDGEDYYESFKQDLDIKRVEIKNIYLAYYESREYQKYLQPIYVFEGKIQLNSTTNTASPIGDIIMYYPAVRGDFVEKAKQ